MINRVIKSEFSKRFGSGRAIVVIGARQVGKTTLIKTILKDLEHLFLDGDDSAVRSLLNTQNTEVISNIIGKNRIVFVDEAQRIDHIGIFSKIIIDQFPHVQLILSGSSSFDLNNQINEPLTGRKWEYQLHPISWKELDDHIGYVKSEQQLELRIIYGMYPDVISHRGEEVDILRELVNSYLYKDVLSLSGIRKPKVLEKLLRAIAFQIGNEVSHNELAQLLGIDKNTVSNYIDVLEKSFVLFSLPSFSRNLRNEIKRGQKIYFYDTGVRNAIIGNFSRFDNRADIGVLWENFLISERTKKLSYQNPLVTSYFWRTTRQQEIDYLEEEAGVLNAFEFKWNPKAKVKYPKTFLNTYQTDLNVIHRDNFRSFL